MKSTVHPKTDPPLGGEVGKVLCPQGITDHFLPRLNTSSQTEGHGNSVEVWVTVSTKNLLNIPKSSRGEKR